MKVERDGRGRIVGTVLHTKHFDKLSPMLQQLEDERVKRGYTMDRMDIEAGYSVGYWQSCVNDNRSIRVVTLQKYATALGKSWKLV
jgi:hypothetical protein